MTEKLAAAEPIFIGLPSHTQGAMGMKGLGSTRPPGYVGKHEISETTQSEEVGGWEKRKDERKEADA